MFKSIEEGIKMLNKEIGGYLEIERSYGKEYFSGLALNTSRNCLQF